MRSRAVIGLGAPGLRRGATTAARHRLAAGLLVVAALAIAATGSQVIAAGTTPLLVAAAPTVPPMSTTSSPPACRVGDKATKYASTSTWPRTLLDWTFRLPTTYRPSDLVSTSSAGLSGGGYVRRVALADLRAMASAARAAGARLAVQSAFRSYSTQVSTFRYWVSRSGYARAINASARAGHSEHQLGTAIDFRSYGGGVPWAFDWATTRAGAWMAKNAWKFGWIMSYPKGKQASTCYSYEPWHYRYYGRTVAAAIHASGQTTRLWLWRHGNNPGWVDPSPTPTPTPTPTPAPTSSPTPTPPASTPTPTARPTPTSPAAPTPSTTATAPPASTGQPSAAPSVVAP